MPTSVIVFVGSPGGVVLAGTTTVAGDAAVDTTGKASCLTVLHALGDFAAIERLIYSQPTIANAVSLKPSA